MHKYNQKYFVVFVKCLYLWGMEDLLKALGVIQEKRIPKYVYNSVLTRINPYNPFSYLFLVIGIVLNIPLYGIINTIDQLKRNPFKYK